LKRGVWSGERIGERRGERKAVMIGEWWRDERIPAKRRERIGEGRGEDRGEETRK